MIFKKQGRWLKTKKTVFFCQQPSSMDVFKTCRHKIAKDFDLNAIRPYHLYKSQWDDIWCPEQVRCRVPNETDWELDAVNSTGNKNKVLCEPGFIRDKVTLLFILYRGVIALLFIGFTIFSTTCQPHLYPIFLTNWSLSLQTVYFVLMFLYVVTMRWRFRNKDSTARSEVVMVCDHNNSSSDKCNNEHYQSFKMHDNENNGTTSRISILRRPGTTEKFLWIYANIVYTLPFCVTVGYWFIVYSYNPEQKPCSKFRSHFIAHSGNSIFALIDFLIVAIPIRITHFVFLSAFMALYVIFTYLYDLLEGTYKEGKHFIYSVLDWKENFIQAAVISTLIAVVLAPLAHTVFGLVLYKIRRFVHRQLKIFLARNNVS